MERIELYKEFRIRAYEDWSGQWLAEAKKPFDTHPEYIATPFGHPTPEAAIALIKRMIDSPSTTIKRQKRFNSAPRIRVCVRAITLPPDASNKWAVPLRASDAVTKLPRRHSVLRCGPPGRGLIDQPESDALANRNRSAAKCPTLTRSGHRASVSSDWVTSWQCVLLLDHHRHQARNHCRRTLGIAALRPYPFQ
jgi:hypothetical protein